MPSRGPPAGDGPAWQTIQCGHSPCAAAAAPVPPGRIVTAVAAFPRRAGSLACSVSSDAELRVWDYRRRRLHTLGSGRPAAVHMGLGGTCCDVAGDGASVAVGHDNGSVTVWDAGRLECRAQVAGGSSEAVGAVRFCPQSRCLAVAWGDAAISLLLLAADGSGASGGPGSGAVARAGPAARRHSCRVRQMDFSHDGRILRTCDGTGDVLYWTVAGGDRGRLEAAGEAGRGVRDCVWATETCVVGWDKQGLWPSGPGRTSMGLVAAVAVTKAGGTMASGGADGVIRLGRFPAVSGDAQRQEVRGGHASGVAGLAWSSDDAVLWSVGSGDVAVHQWRHVLVQPVDAGAIRMRAD